MSASLVGSEMCIRDRTSGAHAPVGSVARETENPGLLIAFAQGMEETLDPVSYTHLTLPTICSV
eukprot:11570046-Alexandrium_andersonii.AAC.1